MPDLLRAYPLLLGTASPDLLAAATVILPSTQAALAASWHESTFEPFAVHGRAYQIAATTGLLPVAPALPSRVRRAVQEVAGRMLRSQAQRRDLYRLLRHPDGALASALADRQLLVAAPPLVLRNVAEACANHLRAAETLPAEYTAFQTPPALQTAVLTAAADDGPSNGQFMHYQLAGDDTLMWRIKFPDEQGRWRWSGQHALALPAIARRKLAGGWRLAAPDIRVHSDGAAFFDVKLAHPRPALPPLPQLDQRRVLGVDWGVKHLVVVQAVEGRHRLGLPVFFHEDGLLAKLEEIRTHARRCQGLAAQAWNLALITGGTVQAALLALWSARTVEKRALWAKYRRIQKTLAHNAALVIVRRALDLGCTTIAIEALGGLRSQDKGPRINWKVNAQIRTFVHQRVGDLAQEHGLRVKLVSPRHTSLSCPACRALGVRTASPEHPQPVAGGAWFRCSGCGHNASADSVAASNIAALGAHAKKGQRITAMPALERTLAQQRQMLISRLFRLLRQAQHAQRAQQPASYTGAGPVLPFPVGRSGASRHHGYPARIRLSQQRGSAPLLAA